MKRPLRTSRREFPDRRPLGTRPVCAAPRPGGLRLRQSAMLVFLATAAALVGGLYVAARSILLRGFAEIETQQTASHVRRATEAIDRTLEGMSVKASDWGAWDDTCRFIADRNEAFVESNLTPSSLSNLEIDSILFFDAEGVLVSATAIDPATGEPTAPTDGLNDALRRAGLLRHESVTSAKTAIFMLAGDPVLAAARPIVTSDNTGPVRGTVVFSGRLCAQMLESISAQTQLTVELFREDAPGLPADCLTALRELSSVDTWVRPLGEDTVAGYTIVPDANGGPGAVVRVQTPRDVYRQGQLSVRWLVASLLVVGAVVIASALVVLDRLVIARIERMSRIVQRIGRGDEVEPLPEEGVRELAVLAASINRMVATIVAASDQLASRAAELKQKSELLEQSREAAEAANRAKTEFLANMSHEIRTPMTAVLGYAELLMEPGLTDDERAHHVRIIHAAGHGLLSIINDILDISKIEAGHLSVERIPVSPSHAVAEVVSLLRAKADAKGLALTASCETPIPETVHTDPVRVRQILTNIIGNAIKFTEKGEVRITLRARRGVDPATGTLLFEIHDTGLGISPEQIGRLFQPFSQADSSTARRYGGTGLGLCISKRLAEALGGSIDVSSTPGEGTVFRVAIDAGSLDAVNWTDRIGPPHTSADAPPEQAGTAPRSVPPARLHGRVLLADDSPDNQRLLAHILRRAGARVDVADNGAAALDAALLARANGSPHDVILLDMQMPIMDGYAAAARMREAGIVAPIVALTACALSGEREKCIAAGCDAYATKPINRADLLSICHRWMEAGGRSCSLRPAA
jgi:signal transduction histidine kinase/ActR/RegA family two-component response regulator